MPAPIKSTRRYMPGLDGLRAIAVLGVIAYHLGIDWIPGGLLGVSVFFTLSGYLITDLLLAQVSSGGIRFKDFWFARARRLLPALLLMIVIVMAWVTVFGPHQPPSFKEAAGSAIGYFNNWWLIFRDVSYFAAFEAPGPLNHLWSLSIEEQFYILWPFLLLLGVQLVREAARNPKLRPRLALVTFGAALLSSLIMLLIYSPGIDPSRVYYGTDTRASELLVGAALAMVWPSRLLRPAITPQARRTLDIVGVVGLAVILLMFWRAREFSPFLYRGGFLILSIGTAMLVASLAHPAGRLGPIIGCRPMVWIGERSYGIYLWHFPVIILTTPEGADGPGFVRGVLQVAATFAIAALSWKYVEDPIRHGALKRVWAQVRSGEWRHRLETGAGKLAFGACGLVLLMALAGFAGVNTEERKTTPGELTVAATLSAEAAKPVPDGVRCKEVAHLGDSTSEGLVSSDYLPNERQQIATQYARVGATRQHLEVSGARSIHERFEGLPNGADVATSLKEQGFDGCWVFALGTNEAANVAAGSEVGYDERIETMMDIVGQDPVMWVNVRSLLSEGSPYDNKNMRAWDEALVRACDDYPNMRVYDWASDVRNEWFVEDGIHFTTPGYAARAKLIAAALEDAFPDTPKIEQTDSSSCIIVDPEVKSGRKGKAKSSSATAPETQSEPASEPEATDAG